MISYVDTSHFTILDSDDSIAKNCNEIILNHIKTMPEMGYFYSNLYYCDENLKNPKPSERIGKISNDKTNLNECNNIGIRVFKKYYYYTSDEYDLFLKKGTGDIDIYLKMEEISKIY